MTTVLTYMLHSTAVLGAVWLLDRTVVRNDAIRDVMWKVAVVVPLLTTLGSTVDLQVGASPVRHTIRDIRQEEPAIALGSTMERHRYAVDTRCFRQRMGATVPPDPATAMTAARHCATPAGPSGWLLALLGGLASVSLVHVVRHGARSVRLWRLLESGTDTGLDVAPGIRVLQVKGMAGPIAAGLRTIALPGWILDALTDEELRAVLAHEAGHLERRDPLWIWLLRLLEAGVWFQPLNRLARRRVEYVAEFLADDAARRLGHSGRSLARSLALVWGRRAEGPTFAPALSTGEGMLTRRVGRLLGAGPNPPVPDFSVKAAVILLLALLGLCLPAVPAPADAGTVEIVVRIDTSSAIPGLP